MTKLTFLLGLGGVFAIAWSLPAQEEATSVQSGVYSKEQAERGEQLFGEACLVCHQPEEFAIGGYMDGWSGMSADDFVEFVRSTMPEDNPGRLKRQEYIDIIAFFFQQNGLPAGESEMERAALKNIQIEGPFGEPKAK
jgi:quinoprotein glucose dehydrogenase